MEKLWRMDFEQHLRYIEHIVLAAPKRRMPPASIDNIVERVNIPKGIRLDLVDLYYPLSTLGMILRFPKLVYTLFKVIRKVDIVHSGVIGWPLPIGWLANTICLMLKKPFIIVIESLPWRDSPRQFKSRLYEWFAKYFVNRSSLLFVNQPHFKNTLLDKDSNIPAYVYPTVWLRDEDILSDELAKELWEDKQPNTFKFLFAGRLVESKGVLTLLAALKILDARDHKFEFTIIGEGDLYAECEMFIPTLKNIVLKVLKPIQYGAPFFEFLRAHHLAVLPCILDEQPRILLDCYSQAVPVVASDIPGLKSYVDNEKTGWLFESSNTEMLAKKIELALSQPLDEIGLNALKIARKYSHQGMHETRFKLIKQFFC